MLQRPRLQASGLTQGDHLMMAKISRQQQGPRAVQPQSGSAQQQRCVQQHSQPRLSQQIRGLGGSDFLMRLEHAEHRDSQRDSMRESQRDFNGINLTNWEQRSKNIAKLHIQNEMAEIIAKQRMGLLPPQPQPQTPQQPVTLPGGYSQAHLQQSKPGSHEAMSLQRQEQQAQLAKAHQAGRGHSHMAMPQQKVVSIGGGYDAWDDRVPAYLQVGGSAKLMNGREARAQSRGQTSSIVSG